MIVILVTGGREYADAANVAYWLQRALTDFEDICIVQGGARGADKLAKEWGLSRGVPCVTMDAAWDVYKKNAGAVRNGWMLDIMRPNFVIAFPGGPGTANMCKQARERGIPVYPSYG